MAHACTLHTSADEAARLVARLSVHQLALGLSDLAFVRRYPSLGSARTWRSRMVAGAWGQVRVDVWMPVLRSIAAAIETEPALPSFWPGVPDSAITRHLDEARRAGAERDWDCAFAHLAAARREIARLEQEISDQIPY